MRTRMSGGGWGRSILPATRFGRRVIGESSDDAWPGSITFREINNSRVKLTEMDDDPAAMASLINALKAKGVRSEEIRFKRTMTSCTWTTTS